MSVALSGCTDQGKTHHATHLSGCWSTYCPPKEADRSTHTQFSFYWEHYFSSIPTSSSAAAAQQTLAEEVWVLRAPNTPKDVSECTKVEKYPGCTVKPAMDTYPGGASLHSEVLLFYQQAWFWLLRRKMRQRPCAGMRRLPLLSMSHHREHPFTAPMFSYILATPIAPSPNFLAWQTALS